MATTPLLWLALCCEEWHTPRPLAERTWQALMASRWTDPTALRQWVLVQPVVDHALSPALHPADRGGRPGNVGDRTPLVPTPSDRTGRLSPHHRHGHGRVAVVERNTEMARELITTHTTKVYNRDGKHVGDLTDEYFVDRRDGTLHTAQAPRPPEEGCRGKGLGERGKTPTPTPLNLLPRTFPVRPGGPLPPSPRPLPKAATPDRPPIECYALPDTLRLVTERQHGQVPAPLPPPRTQHASVCQRCGCVLCRCPVPKPGGLDAIVALQRQQGRR